MKVLSIFILCLTSAVIAKDKYDDRDMHSFIPSRSKRSVVYPTPSGEDTEQYWKEYAQVLLKHALDKQKIETKARNVILFLGDGMSIPTLGAARVYAGQKKGESGEENYLSFEKFPFTGLSKTYCVDRQVADSACSATAYLCGVKANYGTIGVTGAVKRKDCEAMANKTNHVYSIANWAQKAGKATGIVTTTRVTHASPSGVYAHTAERDWESDADILHDHEDPNVCPDIAKQLIYGETGKHLDVIMGGGRRNFLPKQVKDEEGEYGSRKDGVNLIDEWLKLKEENGFKAKYMWHKKQLENISDYETVLGLFESDHCQYNLDANPETEPTLKEMTASAIKLLDKAPNGYFLFVEGGRIDHGHHATRVHKALDETEQLSLAVEEALRITNPEETLIVVTSDHAHTMSYSGYPDRGNDIFGFAGNSDVDKKPYSTISYANGPGYKHPTENGDRYDITNDPMDDKEYKFPTLAPINQETHGGDDVGIFAYGPWAHLLVGVHEQHLIPHIMAYASCVGDGLKYCDNFRYLRY